MSTLRENVARDPQPSLFALPSERMLRRYAEHRRDHPEVYALLRTLALDAVRSGRRRLGIAALFEVARWQHGGIGKDRRTDFKLDNSLRSLYVRALEENESELRGCFEKRTLRAV